MKVTDVKTVFNPDRFEGGKLRSAAFVDSYPDTKHSARDKACRHMSPDDLNSFWERTIVETAASPLDAQIERVEETLPYQRFRVSYRSLGGTQVRAYLNRPTCGERQARPLPAVVIAPG